MFLGFFPNTEFLLAINEMMESSYYYNKWTLGRPLGALQDQTLLCQRKISPGHWLLLLNLAQAASDYICLKALTYGNSLCSKKPHPNPTYCPQFILITSFSRQRDPKDHQNRLKSSISTASKGKHISSCCYKKISLNLDHQRMAMAHPVTQQELQRHARIL